MYNTDSHPKTNKVRRAIVITAASAFLITANPFHFSAHCKPITDELSNPSKTAMIGIKSYRNTKEVFEDLKKLMANNDYEKALSVCDSGIMLSNSGAQKVYYRSLKAEIYGNLWEEKHEEQLLKNAIRECTFGIREAGDKVDTVPCLNLRASAYKKLGKESESEKDMKRAFAAGDNYAGLEFAVKMKYENKIEQAMSVLNKIIASAPNSDYVAILALTERAKSHLMLKELGGAILDMRKAVSLEEKNAYSHYLLGFALHLAGKMGAKEEFKKSKDLGIDKIENRDVPYYGAEQIMKQDP